MSGTDRAPLDPGERDFLLRQIAELKAKLVNLSHRSERLTRYEAAQILRSHSTHTMTKTDVRAWNKAIDTLCPPQWLEIHAEQDRAALGAALSLADDPCSTAPTGTGDA